MLKFLVDFDINSGKSALGSTLVLPSIAEFGAEEFSDKLSDILKAFGKSLSCATKDLDGFSVGQVTFTLTLNRTGELSILSTIKGNISGQTGIQITLIPNKV